MEKSADIQKEDFETPAVNPSQTSKDDNLKGISINNNEIDRSDQSDDEEVANEKDRFNEIKNPAKQPPDSGCETNQHLVPAKIGTDSSELSTDKKKKVKESLIKKFALSIVENFEYTLNLIYLVSFIIIIFLHLNIPIENEINTIIKNFNNFTDESNDNIFFDRKGVENFNDMIYFKAGINRFVINNKYIIVSKIRITQKRYKSSKSPGKRSSSFINYSEDSAYKSIFEIEQTVIDPFKFNGDTTEDTDTLSNTYSFDKNKSFIESGGYVLTFSKKDTISTYNKSLEDINLNDLIQTTSYDYYEIVKKIKDLSSQFKSNFFNSQSETATILYDYVVLNYELRYIIPVYIAFYVTPTGIIRSEFKVNFLRMSYYNTTTDIFRLVCEIVFVLSLLIYCYIFVLAVMKKNNYEYGEFRRRIRNEKLNLVVLDQMKQESQLKKKRVDSLMKNLVAVQVKKVMRRKHKENTIKKNESSIPEKSDFEKKVEENLKIEIDKVAGSKYIFLLINTMPGFLMLLVSIILSIACIVVWFLFLIKNNTFWSLINSTDNNAEDSFKPYITEKSDNELTLDQVNTTFRISFVLTTYRVLVCLNLLLIFWRFFLFFSELVDKAKIYINCIYMAFTDILSYLIFYINMCLAFSLFTFYLYNSLDAFKDFQSSIQSIFSFILINFDDTYLDMYAQNKLMTIIILFIIIIFMRYIFIKIILAVLLYWFSFSFNLYNSEKSLAGRHKTFNELMSISSSLIFNFLKKFIKLTNSVVGFIICEHNHHNEEDNFNVDPKQGDIVRKSVSLRNCIYTLKTKTVAYHAIEQERTEFELTKREKNEMNLKEEEGGKENSQMKRKHTSFINMPTTIVVQAEELEDELINFGETDITKEESEEITIDAYSESANDTRDILNFNEKKYKSKFIDLIVFILFFLWMIITIFFNFMTPYQYILSEALISTLAKRSLSDNPDPSKYYTTYQNIANSKDLNYFLFEDFPSYFVPTKDNNKKFVIVNNNILFRESIVVSIMKNIYQSNVPQFYELRNLTDNIDYNHDHYKNKTSIKLNNTIDIDYAVNRSYSTLGSYVYNINLIDYSKRKDDPINTSIHSSQKEYNFTSNNDLPIGIYPKIKQTELLIDPLVTHAFIEMILVNYEFDMIIYATLSFKLSEGALVSKTIETCLIKQTGSIFEILSYVFDILFVVFFVYFFYKLIHKIKEISLDYDAWYHNNINSLSFKLKEIRSNFNIEMLRKLNHIFNIIIIIDISILIICAICIAYKVAIIIKLGTLNGMFNNSSITVFVLKSYFLEYSMIKNGYLNASAVLINIFSLRLLVMIDFGRYFRLIIETIKNASDMLIVFVMIILLLQPAFVCYSYIGFGYNIKEFSTFISSFLYTLIELFGTYNVQSIDTMNLGLAYLHFYLYLISLNMILLNLFVATLDKAYVEAKEKLRLNGEKFDWKFAFCFCFYKRHLDNRLVEYQLSFMYDRLKQATVPDQELIPTNAMPKNKSTYSSIELMKLIGLDEYIQTQLNKIKNIETAYLSFKMGVSSSNTLSKSALKDIKPRHYFSFLAINMNAYNSIILSIEDKVLQLEKLMNHLLLFQEFNDFNNKLKYLIRNNKDFVKDVEDLEARFYNEFREFEKYQELNNNILGLDNIKENKEKEDMDESSIKNIEDMYPDRSKSISSSEDEEKDGSEETSSILASIKEEEDN